MKVIIDKDACTACGVCAETCPVVFDLDDNGIAQAKVDTVPSEAEGDVRSAAEECPVEAIKIEE